MFNLIAYLTGKMHRPESVKRPFFICSPWTDVTKLHLKMKHNIKRINIWKLKKRTSYETTGTCRYIQTDWEPVKNSSSMLVWVSPRYFTLKSKNMYICLTGYSKLLSSDENVCHPAGCSAASWFWVLILVSFLFTLPDRLQLYCGWLDIAGAYSGYPPGCFLGRLHRQSLSVNRQYSMPCHCLLVWSRLWTTLI